VVTNEVFEFVRAALVGRRRVLDVGCGRGELAEKLAGVGFEVTAIDVSLDRVDRAGAPKVAFVESDLLDYRAAAPFDAVVFVASLHHIAPLDAAVARAHALLANGGIVVLDDFAIEAPDAPTLDWYYATQELLVRTSSYPQERLDAPVGSDLLSRWRDAHEHDPPLHRGDAMLSATGARFRMGEPSRGPFLHRYVAHGLPQTPAHAALAKAILAAERALIDTGTIRPAGLRAIATKLTSA
jgi:SAM-dependent methyltransferase